MRARRVTGVTSTKHSGDNDRICKSRGIDPVRCACDDPYGPEIYRLIDPEPPRSPDYSLEATWAAFPNAQLRRMPPHAPVSPLDPDAAPSSPYTCDVFFIPSTPLTVEACMDGDYLLLLPWDDPRVTRELALVLTSQASVFSPKCKVYAPRYRQPTGWALNDPETVPAQKAFENAYADVVRAFRFYMKYENNGHPFMIASSHQGSAFALRLIQEFVDGTALLSRFVAGYLVEGSIPMETFLCSMEDPEDFTIFCNLRQIRLSEHRKDTGCIVGWQVGTNKWLPVCHWHARKGWKKNDDCAEVTCVNPLSWEEDDQRVVGTQKAKSAALVVSRDGCLNQEALSFSAQVLGGRVHVSANELDNISSSFTEDDSFEEELFAPAMKLTSNSNLHMSVKQEQRDGEIENIQWTHIEPRSLNYLYESPGAAYELFYGSIRRNIDDRLRAWTLRTAPWFRPPTKQAIAATFGAPVQASIIERYTSYAKSSKRIDGPQHIIKFGPPGSGKTIRKGSAVTSYLKSIDLDPTEVLDVAVDDIVISMGPYFREVMKTQRDKHSTPEEKSIRQHQIYRKYRGQADLVADKITAAALAQKASIAMETTGRELYWVRNATEEARQRGYMTRVVFPYATMAQLVNRTMERAQSRFSSGFGRGIHPMAISDITMRSQKNFFELIKSADVTEAAIVDNTVGMYDKKRVLFSWTADGKHGKVVVDFPEDHVSDIEHTVTPNVKEAERLQSFSKHWYNQMRTLCTNFARSIELKDSPGVLSYQENPSKTKLYIFDFDGTLFRTPLPPPWWNFRWWDNPDSLDPPTVPETPSADWWVKHVVEDAKAAIRDPNTIAVLMTGRKELLFRTRIEALLAQAGLDGLDWVFLGDDRYHTSATKCNQMRAILEANPSVDEIHIFEDRYMETYTEYLGLLSKSRTLGRNLEIVPHDIKERPNPPRCNPWDFMYAFNAEAEELKDSLAVSNAHHQDQLEKKGADLI
eukprot:CAMPEP_0167763338 /NCGR_PEP_ID=MMETSP0110_2-20121227/13304_1 /TAXON_ID=629695 /ORGANISM="Gymnochlora sp., Strain CCMP2014" /LENGTH=977 /DNA_ID=CAMNT_0007650385 /DNA_START=352 /DNA_END=3285 /DNA_ORIENTATION=+